MRDIIFNRLKFHGMESVRLPLGIKASEPHIPVLVSKNLATASRVIILFGDSFQDLAVFAMRICGGRGGINVGSAVDFVKYVQTLPSVPDRDADHPGIILANVGQLHWSRREHKALTYTSWKAMKRPSAVHEVPIFDPIYNTVEHNRNPDEHVACILSSVVPSLCRKNAKLDIITIGDSGSAVTKHLDEKWDSLNANVQSLAVAFPTRDHEDFKNEDFKCFLRKRARGYIMDDSPPDTGIYGPLGGNKSWQWGFGMNVYSLGYESHEEEMFPRRFKYILDWMQEVARDPEYANEEIIVQEEPEELLVEEVAGEQSEWAADMGANEPGADWMPLGDDDLSPSAAVPADDRDATEVAAKKATAAFDGSASMNLDGAADQREPRLPERIERLPSFVKTDDGPLAAVLTKEEKAVVLQTSV